MVSPSEIVLFIIVAPFILSLISILIAKIPKVGASFAKALCIATLIIVLTLLIFLIPEVKTNPISAEFYSFSLVNVTVTIGVYVDLFSLLFASLCTFIGVLVSFYTIHYISSQNKAHSLYPGFNALYPLSLGLIASIIGTLFSSNLIGLLFFWELISISLFGLISFWYRERESTRAGFKCFLMTQIGSLALFVAIIIIFFETGTLSILELQNSLVPTGIITLIILSLILTALLPKTVQMPFHTWLPDSTVAPTPVVLLILVSDSAGIYLMMRFFTQTFLPVLEQLPLIPFSGFFGTINVWSFIISTIGIITLISAAANALLETKLKRILAYSVISELGFCVLVTGFASSMGLTSGLFYLTSHLFVSGLLFLCIGAVIFRTGKTDINQIGGLYKYMPITTIFTAISVLSIGGLPLLSEFMGKYLIIQSTFEIGSPFFLAATILGGVFHLAISLRLLYSVFLDKDKQTYLSSSVSDPPITMLAPMFILAGGIVILGVVPNLLLDNIILPAIGQMGYQANLEPLGILTTSIGHWAPLAIAVSIITLVSALSLFVTRFTKKKNRDIHNDDAFKPFLCGEDPENQYDLQEGVYFDSVIQNLKLDEAKRATDVDRFYYFIYRKFSRLCDKLSSIFDIEQKFSIAFLSFFIATVVILIIVIFAV